MMQILLTVIGLLLAAGAGYSLILNYSVQTISSEVGDTSERLDLAAASIQRMATLIPGTSEYVAPKGTKSPDLSFTTMPAGSGPYRSTVDGIPFMYCPVGVLSDTEVGLLEGKTNGKTYYNGGDYTQLEYGSLVVQTSYAFAQGVKTRYNPIAFIVAPERGRSTSVGCHHMGLKNGQPHLANSIVRVVSAPKVDLQGTKTIYVSGSGKGGGTGPKDRASINAALMEFVNRPPEEMTISISDATSVSSAVWQAFRNASAESGARLAIVGETGSAAISFPSGYDWNVPANTTLRNVSLSGSTVIVAAGDMLDLTGSVGLQSPSSASAIVVEGGGEVSAYNAVIAISNPGKYGFDVQGTLKMVGSHMAGVNGALDGSLILRGGELRMTSSRLGYATGLSWIRPTTAGIIMIGGGRISGGTSSDVIANGSARCHYTADGNTTLKWASQTILAIFPEGSYTAPDFSASAAARDTYERERQERAWARQRVFSTIRCN